MGKYSNYFNSLSAATAATCYSPAVVLIKEGDLSQLMHGTSGATEMHIYGSEIGSLSFEKPMPSYQMVDLGLPSGLKWANMNVGATAPEESGKFFAWGETEGHEYTGEGSFSGLFTTEWYNTLDCASLQSDITPDGGYDAARANMGGTWRMPTKAEEEELLAETTQEVVTIGGVKGTKFTSKTNENYIFVPFAGLGIDGSLNFVGGYSYLWSASRGGESSAWDLGCYSDGGRGMDNGGRYCGSSVRGVSE